MVVSRMHNNGKGQGTSKNQKSSRLNIEQMGPKKSFCVATAGLDMLVWLKGLALDPCQPDVSKDLIQKFWYQTFKLRKMWHTSNEERRQRKRKLKQFLNGGKSTAASGLASENSNHQNFNKVTCQQSVRNSCSPDSALTFDNSFERKKLYTDSIIASSSTDTDESSNVLNLFSRESFILQDQPSVDSSDLISSPHSSSSVDKLQQTVCLLRNNDSENESENLPRAVIPIGPRFQAEVPDWMGPVNKESLYDSESLKLLGSKVWPIEEAIPKSNMRRVGSGRPQFCSCVSPGSADCISCHMLSARHNLQSELGPAFLSWKFDEMGEVVSKKWTTKEQIIFEAFVKTYLLSNEAEFWEHAAKRISSKSKKMLLSYYYNVFTPRRMSRLTRSSLDQVDSDEDHVDDNKHL